MNRIEKVREFIDKRLLDKKDTQDRRCAYVHLHDVSLIMRIDCKKREANVELAVMRNVT